MASAAKLGQSGLQERDADKMTQTRPETHMEKLRKLAESEGPDYEKYRMQNILVGNIGAGSDTTGISLTSTLFHLAKEQSTFQKLRQEIRNATERGEADSPITFDQAQRLPYLQMVIKEGLRIHAAVGLPLWRVVPDTGAHIAGQQFPGKVRSRPNLAVGCERIY